MAFFHNLPESRAKACDSGRHRPQQCVDRFCGRSDDIADDSELAQGLPVFWRKPQWLVAEIVLRIFPGSAEDAMERVPLLQALDERERNFLWGPRDAKLIIDLAIGKSRLLHSPPFRGRPIADLAIGKTGLFQEFGSCRHDRS